MAKYHTVKIVTRQKISRFDNLGRKTGEYEDQVRLTFSDLSQTDAQTYAVLYGADNVEIVEQIGATTTALERRQLEKNARRTSYARRQDKRNVSREATRKATLKRKTKNATPTLAPRADTYSGVLNSMMG